jgi:hypothetical protein
MRRWILKPRRHDPFWDLDGSAVRRSRTQRRLFTVGLAVLVVIFVGLVVARLPAFDPQLITTNGSLRPVLGVAILALLASCFLIAAERFRMTSLRG